jgi:hypothetical protein
VCPILYIANIIEASQDSWRLVGIYKPPATAQKPLSIHPTGGHVPSQRPACCALHELIHPLRARVVNKAGRLSELRWLLALLRKHDMWCLG